MEKSDSHNLCYNKAQLEDIVSDLKKTYLEDVESRKGKSKFLVESAAIFGGILGLNFILRTNLTSTSRINFEDFSAGFFGVAAYALANLFINYLSCREYVNKNLYMLFLNSGNVYDDTKARDEVRSIAVNPYAGNPNGATLH